uniref:Uncharacterized protein n=1 Tax=Moniliophthora roreri TaxID=221103 RepID=A0A0W0EY46_MONRR
MPIFATSAMPMLRLGNQLVSGLYTLFLFTKSDVILVVFPMLIIALVLVGPTDFISFYTAFIWLELHLLAFDIKNQLIGIEEDRLCKPDRPFPSGRISPEKGQALYITVVAASFCLSFFQGLTVVSTAYFCATTLYNEYGLSRNLVLKSPTGAVGYMCYCWGTTYIMGHNQPLDTTAISAIICSGLVFSFTGHAQDFRDRSGDALMGRKTVPLALSPGAARWSLFFIIFAFTMGLIQFWSPPLPVSTTFICLCFVTSLRFIIHQSEEEDRKSFRCFGFFVPTYSQFSNAFQLRAKARSYDHRSPIDHMWFPRKSVNQGPVTAAAFPSHAFTTLVYPQHLLSTHRFPQFSSSFGMVSISPRVVLIVIISG